MGKQVGNYLTWRFPGCAKNTALQDKVIRVFYKELRRMFNLNGQQNIMVIGLGNWNVTPDALAAVVRELFVTRHILEMKPDILGMVSVQLCHFSGVRYYRGRDQ